MQKAPIVSVDLIVQNPKGHLLLGQVSQKWQDGGKYVWGLPGREVALGENLRTCVSRNLKEEVGVSLVSARIVCVNSNFGYGRHYIGIGILVKAKGKPKVTRPEDWLEWRWFSPSDIPSRLFPSAERTLTAFQKGILSLDFKKY